MISKAKIIVWSFLAFVLPLAANAQIQEAAEGFEDNLSRNRIRDILQSVAEWFLILFAVIAVVMTIWSAFLFLTAGDNEDTLKKAKRTLIYAIIGIVIAFIAFSIVTFTLSFLG